MKKLCQTRTTFTSLSWAMEHAIRILRALPEWQWITFCAQGAGASDQSIHCAEVRLLQDKLDAGGSLNVTEITTLAKVSGQCLVPEEPLYSIAAATPEEAARLLNTLFRHPSRHSTIEILAMGFGMTVPQLFRAV